MSAWILQGIETGVKTTRYPDKTDDSPGVTPGFPGTTELNEPHAAQALAATCPMSALASEGSRVLVADRGLCVHCFRCARNETPIAWRDDVEWATLNEGSDVLAHGFARSLHVLVVDAGDCGACLSEVAQLAGPYYNAHRLGIFVTPTPRHADVMLVVGPMTDHMAEAARRCYDAMPDPKRVVAVGACAISGGVFGRTFASLGGVASVVPVDVTVPGCPPPPLAILHALLVVTGRRVPAGIVP